MTLQTANPELMRYFQQQQTTPGWFDLLTIMVDGMVSNAGEQESKPFLQQMGAVMAAQYPLSAPQTLGELEGQINARLAQFHWGCVDIVADDSGLNLRHQALPACDNAAGRVSGAMHSVPYWKGFTPLAAGAGVVRRTSWFSVSASTR